MCDCLRSVSLVWILASVCVCACGVIVSSVGFWGDSRVARRAADEDGWMNVNISFTLLSQRLGWFICLRRCCHLACLMCTPTLPTDGSFRVPPPPSLISVFGKCSKRAHASLPRHANVHLSTRVDIRLHLQLYSSLRQVVFFENKYGKTSAEMWSHAARSPLQMVPLGRRGTFQPLSPAVFAHKLPLLLLLSVAII